VVVYQSAVHGPVAVVCKDCEKAEDIKSLGFSTNPTKIK
jgi:hypothetical protein